jgi:hypothetical protein
MPMPQGTQSAGFISHLAQSDPDSESVLSRLDRIETILGISKERDAVGTVSIDSDPDEEGGMPISDLWKAVRHLRVITRPPQDHSLWSRSTVKSLWESYVFFTILFSTSARHGLMAVQISQ